ncbi:hypothetical protein AI2941V1_0282, partial [Enterobacter cloacae]
VKLIEFLISKGCDGWKWPNGIRNASCNACSRDVIFHFEYCPPSLTETLIAPRDFDSYEIVTREQYEAALAASKTEWDGEGFPPVGSRVEANYGGEWVEATVAYTDRPEGHSDAVAWKEALVFDCKTTRPFWADEFRPIRSEADKKRDSIISMIEKAYKDCPHSDAVPQAIYEAIAEHIRID